MKSEATKEKSKFAFPDGLARTTTIPFTGPAPDKHRILHSILLTLIIFGVFLLGLEVGIIVGQQSATPQALSTLDTPKAKSITTPQPTNSPPPKPTATPFANTLITTGTYKGWRELKSTDLGLTIKYPDKDWADYTYYGSEFTNNEISCEETMLREYLKEPETCNRSMKVPRAINIGKKDSTGEIISNIEIFIPIGGFGWCEGIGTSSDSGGDKWNLKLDGKAYSLDGCYFRNTKDEISYTMAGRAPLSNNTQWSKIFIMVSSNKGDIETIKRILSSMVNVK
jgi:hypothetical protein